MLFLSVLLTFTIPFCNANESKPWRHYNPRISYELPEAIKTGKVEKVLKIADQLSESDVNWAIDGKPPLHIATLMRNKEMIENLVEMGANVNGRDNFHDTPLMIAADSACENNSEVISLLLELGANIKARNYKGETALNKAVKQGHIENFEALMKHESSKRFVKTMMDRNEAWFNFLSYYLTRENTTFSNKIVFKHGSVLRIFNDVKEIRNELKDDMNRYLAPISFNTYFSRRYDNSDDYPSQLQPISKETPVGTALRYERYITAEKLSPSGGQVSRLEIMYRCIKALKENNTEMVSHALERVELEPWMQQVILEDLLDRQSYFPRGSEVNYHMLSYLVKNFDFKIQPNMALEVMRMCDLDELVRFISWSGIDLKETAVVIEALKCHPSLLRRLFRDFDVDVNFKDDDGFTALNHLMRRDLVDNTVLPMTRQTLSTLRDRGAEMTFYTNNTEATFRALVDLKFVHMLGTEETSLISESHNDMLKLAAIYNNKAVIEYLLFDPMTLEKIHVSLLLACYEACQGFTDGFKLISNYTENLNEPFKRFDPVWKRVNWLNLIELISDEDLLCLPVVKALIDAGYNLPAKWNGFLLFRSVHTGARYSDQDEKVAFINYLLKLGIQPDDRALNAALAFSALDEELAIVKMLVDTFGLSYVHRGTANGLVTGRASYSVNVNGVRKTFHRVNTELSEPVSQYLMPKLKKELNSRGEKICSNEKVCYLHQTVLKCGASIDIKIDNYPDYPASYKHWEKPNKDTEYCSNIIGPDNSNLLLNMTRFYSRWIDIYNSNGEFKSALYLYDEEGCFRNITSPNEEILFRTPRNKLYYYFDKNPLVDSFKFEAKVTIIC